MGSPTLSDHIPRSLGGRRREDMPFNDTTMYYQTISTALRRHQMSTFPMVRALCNAMVLAGFRAEMDAEGDIWF